MMLVLAAPGVRTGALETSGQPGSPAPAQRPHCPCCGVKRDIVQGRQVPPSRVSLPLTDNDIAWTFTQEISEDVRRYILGLWADIRAPLRAAVGPPSAAITVEVSYDPGMEAGGSYYNLGNAMHLKHLPDSADDPLFNWIFTHETVHAFQDASLDVDVPYGRADWAVEGVAVCATELVSQQLQGRRGFIAQWGLGTLSSRYDPFAQMGADALAGSRDISDALSIHWSYANSGGFWWLLTAAESRAQSGDWAHVDYLARFHARHFGEGRPYTQEAVLASVEETAALPVDGRPARQWAARQPITKIDSPPGVGVWAASDGTILMWRPYQRYDTGGRAYPLYGKTVSFKAWGLGGADPVWQAQYTSQSNGDAYEAFLLPDGIGNVPGSYHFELDGASFGAGKTDLVVQVLPQQYRGDGIGSGVGVAFYDPSLRQVVRPPFLLFDGTILGEWNGGLLVKPQDLSANPSSFSMAIQSSQPSASVRDLAPVERSVPLPYRRMLRVEIPQPLLRLKSVRLDDDSAGESAGDGDGYPDFGETVEVRVEGVNAGELPTLPGPVWVEWTDPADPGARWIRSEVQVPRIGPGQSLELPAFLMSVTTQTIFDTGGFNVLWRDPAGDPAVIGSKEIVFNAPGIEELHATANVVCSDPRRDGRRLVWSGYYNGRVTPFEKDLDTGAVRILTPDPDGGTAPLYFQDARSGLAAFVEGQDGTLWLYDLATGQSRILDAKEGSSGASSLPGNSSVGERYVAWTHTVGGTYNRIKVWDRQTQQSSFLTEYGASQMQPRVAGSAVVFMDDRRVRLRDLGTGEDRWLSDAGPYVAAGFDGRFAAWVRNNVAKIWVHELATGATTEYALASRPGIPEVDGDWAACWRWQETTPVLQMVHLPTGRLVSWPRPDRYFNGGLSLRDGKAVWVELQGITYRILEAGLSGL